MALSDEMIDLASHIIERTVRRGNSGADQVEGCVASVKHSCLLSTISRD
jgi:hypothetical protein